MKKKRAIQKPTPQEAEFPGFETIEDIYKEIHGKDYNTLSAIEKQLVDKIGVNGEGLRTVIMFNNFPLYSIIEKEFDMFFDKIMNIVEENQEIVASIKEKLLAFCVIQIYQQFQESTRLQKILKSSTGLLEDIQNEKNPNYNVLREILKNQVREPIKNFFYLANLAISFFGDTKEEIQIKVADLEHQLEKFDHKKYSDDKRIFHLAMDKFKDKVNKEPGYQYQRALYDTVCELGNLNDDPNKEYQNANSLSFYKLNNRFKTWRTKKNK